MSLTIGLCLKGVAVGTLAGVAVSIVVILLMFLLPMAMSLGSMLFGGVAATGGGVAGASWPIFAEEDTAIPTWLLAAPGAIGFAGGFLWAVRQGVRS